MLRVYKWVYSVGIANKHAHGRIGANCMWHVTMHSTVSIWCAVSVLEGGYTTITGADGASRLAGTLSPLATSVAAHVRALAYSSDKRKYETHKLPCPLLVRLQVEGFIAENQKRDQPVQVRVWEVEEEMTLELETVAAKEKRRRRADAAVKLLVMKQQLEEEGTIMERRSRRVRMQQTDLRVAPVVDTNEGSESAKANGETEEATDNRNMETTSPRAEDEAKTHISVAKMEGVVETEETENGINQIEEPKTAVGEVEESAERELQGVKRSAENSTEGHSPKRPHN
eukprot:Platyproteum_vivax@DN7157_c0_g1_i1.p1